MVLEGIQVSYLRPTEVRSNKGLFSGQHEGEARGLEETSYPGMLPHGPVRSENSMAQKRSKRLVSRSDAEIFETGG